MPPPQLPVGIGEQIQALLKEGTKSMSGLEDAVYRNIEAAQQLAQITRTSFGPNGMNKMIINHLGKLFVTSDAACVLPPAPLGGAGMFSALC